jgi:peptidoglycan/xylan/chitin deacetylase (PgdA/CDA1 family)
MENNLVPWPGNAKCAVAFTFDMDADSFLHLGRPQDSYRRIAVTSELRFGPLEGVPRILALYRKYNLRQSFFVPAWCIEQYPGVIESILKDGHEIGHHGYIHEHPNEIAKDEEEHWLERGVEIIEKHTGQRPRGYRAPLYNFSENTLELLHKYGFLYDASLMGHEQPYIIKSSGAELIELPSHWTLDDWPPYVHISDINFVMQIMSPSVAIAGFQEEFDAAWEQGGLWIAVWHPFVTGRRARIRAVERLIDYMINKGDVWFASMEDIAAHVRSVVDSGQYTPVIDEIPYYQKPVNYERYRNS